jgi:hypothetical protein
MHAIMSGLRVANNTRGYPSDHHLLIIHPPQFRRLFSVSLSPSTFIALRLPRPIAAFDE